MKLPNLAQLQATRIMVVGDVMLDRYWYGHVDRISPEAPVPVGEGTSVPIASPKFVLAPEAVVAPVPPLMTAKVPVRFAASTE